MLDSVWIAFLITLGISVLWLRLVDLLAHKGLISSKISRKIIHIGTGPIFVLCWVFFPEKTLSRYIAALIPFAITAQFFAVGIGWIKDQPAVDALSRSGNPREILRGPLIYGIVFVVLTIVFWTDQPHAMIGLMILCGGDGIADLIGRNIKSPHLPWSKSKTVAGTLGMFLGGLVTVLIILAIFYSNGTFQGDFSMIIPELIIISLIATGVESLPIKDFDNLTVPIISVIVSMLLLTTY